MKTEDKTVTEPIPHCCHVDTLGTSCPNTATVETAHKTEPYAGTQSCLEHLPWLLADCEVAWEISTGAAVAAVGLCESTAIGSSGLAVEVEIVRVLVEEDGET